MTLKDNSIWSNPDSVGEIAKSKDGEVLGGTLNFLIRYLTTEQGKHNYYFRL